MKSRGLGDVYKRQQQKNGKPLGADIVYKETWLWLKQRGCLVRPASKSCRFSHHPLRVPKGWHRDFAACGQRSGLLAHTSAAFLKNCWSKKLFVCLRLVIENTSPRKTIRIRFGKAGAHPQLAWESQLPLKPCSLITTFCF